MQSLLNKIKITHFSLIALTLLVLAGCGKERTNILARTYHKTTSYFNGYYNANEILKITTRAIDDQYEYPGGDFFDIYYLGDEEEVKGYEGDFDKIIEKNDIVIYKHPNGGFADDCRFMNGQSHFYKKSYSLAMENFDYVVETYPKSKLLPRAYLWMARCQYQAGNPELALDVLGKHILPYDTIEWSKKGALEMAIFRAKLARDTANYEAAVEWLKPEVEHVKGRHNRAKAHFLLGQLQTKTDNYPLALEQFGKVEKYSQDYDLTFMSKMKIARLYVVYQEGQDDEGKVYDYLNKLLKDEKNQEYADQIYYEFGLLELKKDSNQNAIEYFHNAIAANVGKPRYKALSAYQIGNVFFEEYQEYDSAQVYYDMAASTITEDDPEYKEITRIAKTLRDYVTYKTTITYQDSMIYLYGLSDEELGKVVAKVAEKEEKERLERLRKEKERMRQEEQARQSMLASGGGAARNNQFLQNFGQQNRNNRRPGGGPGGSNWYFDNPTAMTQGIQQFQQQWGRRANEDNWRISRKQAFASASESAEGAEGARPGAGPAGPAGAAAGGGGAPMDSSLVEQYGDNAKYYRDIPKNEEDVEQALVLIEDAMYQLGQIYAQKLNQPDSAIKTFESLLDRFEGSEYTLRTRYALYQLYKDADNPIFNVHKNFIINEHPKTVYAYLLLGKDPKDLKQEENDFDFAYTGLFSAYRNRQYETAIGFSEFLMAQFGLDNPKLDYAEVHYIRGMSYGYLGNRDSLRDILTYVVSAFPEAEVTPVAQKTLDFLNGASGAKPGGKRPVSATKKPVDPELADPNNPLYKGFAAEPKANDKIFVLMYLNQENIPKSEATSSVSDFNRANFPKMNLKTFTFLYKGQFLLPYISHFSSEEEAATYVNKFLQDPLSKRMLIEEDDKIFYISHSNFKVAYGRKRMEDYILYYENILTR
jgi:tetratricopeptide (TPR) repeat protein